MTLIEIETRARAKSDDALLALCLIAKAAATWADARTRQVGRPEERAALADRLTQTINENAHTLWTNKQQ